MGKHKGGRMSFQVVFERERQYSVWCPATHRHPYHLAGYITIDLYGIPHYSDGGECIEQTKDDLKEIIKAMEELEKKLKKDLTSTN